MNQVWRAYVLSNVHISLCAVFFCWAGYELFDIEVNLWVLLFLFSGSLCTYTLHRIISGRTISHNDEGHNRFSFVRAIGKWKLTYVSILIAFALLSFSMLSQQMRLYLAILSALSIGYIIPVLGSEKRLRDINLLKIFLVALVWSGIFLIPVIGSHSDIEYSNLLILFLEKFIFIFALTLPFDYRDRDLDKEAKTKTLANVYSTNRIKTIIVISLIICSLFAVILNYRDVYSTETMISLLGFYLLQSWLSLRIHSDTDEIYYLGILDGLIMLQGILIIMTC